MARYVRETHFYDEGGFTVDGRIIEVLSYNDIKGRLTVLVEKPEPTDFSEDGAALPEPMSFESADDAELRITTYFCNAEKSDGDQCTREVDEYGERCWQHEENEEDKE